MIKKVYAIAICSLFLIAGFIPTISSNEPIINGNQSRTTLYVGGTGHWNYTTIQSAINDASPGDTVFVYNGIYYENIHIHNYKVNLIGENVDNTIIDGSGAGNVIELFVDFNNISGFTVTNGSKGIFINNSDNNCILDNNVSNNNNGIFITTSTENNIQGNHVNSNNNYGINLHYSNNNLIQENNVLNNKYGIRLDHSDFNNLTENNEYNSTYYGIFNVYSDNNLITDNNASNTSYGIYVYGSNDNIVKGNTVSNCLIGIQLESDSDNIAIGNHASNCSAGISMWYSYNNQVIENNAFNNSYAGIYMFSAYDNNPITGNKLLNNDHGIYLNSASDNIIYNNYFDNTNNAYEDGDNIWNTTKTLGTNIVGGPYLGGNYWSDYNGTDTNGDLLGDTNLPYGPGDNLPLIQPIDVVYIDDDYDTSTPGWQYDHFDVIQDGIDAVAQEGTVYVCNGSYYENVIVNKTIDLIGEDRNTTIIDANVVDHGIRIFYTDEVSVSGFLVINASYGISIYFSNNCIINNNILNYSDCGILFYGSQYADISNNIVFNVTDYGIFGDSSSHINIINNSIKENSIGILLLSGTGNKIKNNSINQNENGIYLHQNSYCTIYGNNISKNNDDGIYLENSNENEISGNIIFNNTNNGIFIQSGNMNTIFDNIFKNTYNALDFGSYNKWNITKIEGTNIIGGPFLGGNYWNNYTGLDTDGDGLGDTNIPYGPGDYLPLTNFQLEVNQSIFDRGFPIRHAADGDWAAAQSFTPTLDTLTSCEIYMRKFGVPEFNLTVNLRTVHPQGPIIDTLIFTPEELPSSWTWFPLDFNDTLIVPNTEYFIVCPPAPSGVTTSFGYEWGYAFGNQYDGGAFWFTRDGGALWRDLPTSYEFVFRTYGYN